MSAAISRVRHARDEAVRLQSVEQANQGHRRDVEHSREGGLIYATVPRDLHEHNAPRPGHAGKLRANLAIAALAPQQRRVVEQPHDLRNRSGRRGDSAQDLAIAWRGRHWDPAVSLAGP